jgi:hypothetical protein
MQGDESGSVAAQRHPGQAQKWTFAFARLDSFIRIRNPKALWTQRTSKALEGCSMTMDFQNVFTETKLS